jgi:hypothetical protein
MWMGRAEVRALAGADPELPEGTSAYVIVFAYASSWREFEWALERFLREGRVELMFLEDAGPAHEMLVLDEDKMAQLLETAETGNAAGVFYPIKEPEDGVDEEWEAIRDAAARGEAVQFRLIGRDFWHLGFVADISDRWAVMNVVDQGRAEFDGYVAVRSDSFMEVEDMSKDDTFLLAALELRGARPTDPGLPLDDHRSLLTALAPRYPLVGLADATEPRDVLQTGRILVVGDDAVTLRGADPLGRWTGEHVHEYKNIEAVHFADAYHGALALVLGRDDA